MNKFFSILDLLVATINKNVAVVGIILGVTLAFANVLLRYLFNASITWAGELTNYLFIWSALFGAAYGFKTGIHISVTILLHAFPKPMAKWILVFSHFISFCYLAFSAYLGYQLVLLMMELEEMSVDLNIPMWIPQLVLPLAFGGAAYRAFEKVLEVAKTDASKVLAKSEAELIRDSVVKE